MDRDIFIEEITEISNDLAILAMSVEMSGIGEQDEILTDVYIMEHLVRARGRIASLLEEL